MNLIKFPGWNYGGNIKKEKQTNKQTKKQRIIKKKEKI